MSKKTVVKTSSKPKYKIQKYSVVLFVEEEVGKLFECIPDLWFVDETRTSCFWPPKTGKSFTLRAIQCEKPDDTYVVWECTVISRGHLTYNAGFKIVKEKCSQKYNTSSADEHENAARFRRQHPGLVDENIEHVFKKPSTTNDLIEEPVGNQNGGSQIRQSSENIVKKAISSTGTVNKLVSGDGRNVKNSSKKSNGSKSRSVSPSSSLCSEKKSKSRSGSRSRSRSRSSSRNSSSSTNRSRSIELIPSRSPSRQSPIRQSKSSWQSRSRQKSRSIPSRSFRSRSNRSRSNRSRSNRSRSNRSRSNRSRSNRSRSNRSRSNRSRSNRSRSNRSRSNRSRSNRSRSNRSRSRQSRTTRLWSSQSSSYNSRSGFSTSTCRRSNNEKRKRHSIQEDKRGKKLSCSSKGMMVKKVSTNRKNKTLKSNGISALSELPSRSGLRLSRSNSRQSRLCYRGSRSTSHRPSATNYTRQDVKIPLKKHNATNDLPYSHSTSVQNLMTDVKDLSKVVRESNERLTANDRRLYRMEVTINKMFTMLGDMNGSTGHIHNEPEDDRFNVPDFPIGRKTELFLISRQLKDKEFRTFLLNHEKKFCCPTKTSTDTVTVTKYLKRFISVNVRCQLTLKDTGDSGLTLFGHYHRVYLFLIDVIMNGYTSCNKKITFDDAHTALRIVWGRSKQLRKEANNNK